MHRRPLQNLLLDYKNRHPSEVTTDRFTTFIDAHHDCFERSLAIGHVTASAWIVDIHLRTALLIHHKKLGLWLQPGGHCDGDSDVARVAAKEVKEETGLEDYEFFAETIFDLDIHEIPAWEDTPAHDHYDVRFLIYADSRQTITVSHESHDARWFLLSEIAAISSDISVLRLAEKSLAVMP